MEHPCDSLDPARRVHLAMDRLSAPGSRQEQLQSLELKPGDGPGAKQAAAMQVPSPPGSLTRREAAQADSLNRGLGEGTAPAAKRSLQAPSEEGWRS